MHLPFDVDLFFLDTEVDPLPYNYKNKNAAAFVDIFRFRRSLGCDCDRLSSLVDRCSQGVTDCRSTLVDRDSQFGIPRSSLAARDKRETFNR